jgi:hypothetical protein
VCGQAAVSGREARDVGQQRLAADLRARRGAGRRFASLDRSVSAKRARMDFFCLTMISAVESGIGRRQPVRLFLKSV